MIVKLVIQGNADIYLGEFMRLFSHYAFRESLSFKDNQSPAAALLRKYLIDNPSWIDGRKAERQLFQERERTGTSAALFLRSVEPPRSTRAGHSNSCA